MASQKGVVMCARGEVDVEKLGPIRLVPFMVAVSEMRHAGKMARPAQRENGIPDYPWCECRLGKDGNAMFVDSRNGFPYTGALDHVLGPWEVQAGGVAVCDASTVVVVDSPA